MIISMVVVVPGGGGGGCLITPNGRAGRGRRVPFDLGKGGTKRKGDWGRGRGRE